ncbi:uncharacterized protein LOC144134469 [Amblyomma americanum]
MEFINSSLDWKYAPCDDFYSFVCNTFHSPDGDVLSDRGRYLQRTTKAMLFTINVPPTGQSATEKAAGLFHACVRLGATANASEVQSLKSFLGLLGLDMSSMTPDPDFDIAERITRLSLEYGFPTFARFTFFRRPHRPKKTLAMEIDKADEDWMKERFQEFTSVVTLAQFYSSFVRMYDPNLNAHRLATRITRAESTVRQFLADLRQTDRFTGRTTTVEGLGTFTRNFVTQDRWKELIMRYTAFVASDLLVLWDNAPALVVLLLSKNRIARNDSRLLMSWSLLHRLLPLAHGKAMMTAAANRSKGNYDAIPNYCLYIVNGVMEMASV